MGGMMVTKGLGRCGWSYDGVEGLRHLIVTYIGVQIPGHSSKYGAH